MRHLFLLLIALATIPTAQAQFVDATVVPGGEVLDIVVPEGASDTLSVLYRPGATALVSRETVVRDPSASTWAWQPQRAGVVRLSSGGVTQNVSVRYQTFPIGGAVVMLLAGLILFGGIVVSMRTLMRD